VTGTGILSEEEKEIFAGNDGEEESEREMERGRKGGEQGVTSRSAESLTSSGLPQGSLDIGKLMLFLLRFWKPGIALDAAITVVCLEKLLPDS
jgi:hypothetical protein